MDCERKEVDSTWGLKTSINSFKFCIPNFRYFFLMRILYELTVVTLMQSCSAICELLLPLISILKISISLSLSNIVVDLYYFGMVEDRNRGGEPVKVSSATRPLPIWVGAQTEKS